MELSLCRKICELEQSGSDFALAMIIQSSGSTPRKAGSAMLLAADGASWGSIGGGNGEGEIMRLALAALNGKRGSFCHSVTMNNALAGEEGMVCGGDMEVFILVSRSGENDADLE